MTTLDRLYKKGLLERRKAARAFFYSPRLTRDEWERERAGSLVAEFLTGPRIAGTFVVVPGGCSGTARRSDAGRIGKENPGAAQEIVAEGAACMNLSYISRLFCVCLASFFLIYFVLSLLTSATSRFTMRLASRTKLERALQLLIAVRVLPAVAGILAVILLCVPSYLTFEPSATREHVGLACVSRLH